MVSLALIPPEKVQDAFIYLLDKSLVQTYSLEPFCDYSVQTWIEGKIFFTIFSLINNIDQAFK